MVRHIIVYFVFDKRFVGRAAFEICCVGALLHSVHLAGLLLSSVVFRVIFFPVLDAAKSVATVICCVSVFLTIVAFPKPTFGFVRFPTFIVVCSIVIKD